MAIEAPVSLLSAFQNYKASTDDIKLGDLNKNHDYASLIKVNDEMDADVEFFATKAC